MYSPARLFTATGIALAIACAATPGSAQDDMAGFEKRVQRIFEVSYADICPVESLLKAEHPPEIFRTTFNYGDEDYPPRPFALVRFHCYYGAYNETHVFYRVDDYGEIRQVQFAVPEFDVKYVDDDFDGEVDSIDTAGFTSVDLLVNSTVDAETLTVVSWSKWRGIGDASSSGEWVFKSGEFVLTAFDVDASYDGAVNPQRIYGEGLPAYGGD